MRRKSKRRSHRLTIQFGDRLFVHWRRQAGGGDAADSLAVGIVVVHRRISFGKRVHVWRSISALRNGRDHGAETSKVVGGFDAESTLSRG